MKKLVFSSMPLQEIEPRYSAYQQEIHINSNYEDKIYFPINAIMANNIAKDDEIEFITLKFLDDINPDNEENFTLNYNHFIEELNKINKDIGAKLNFEIVETNFEETKDLFENRFIELFSKIKNDSTIYADTTFGPKTMTMILFNLLTFAEKFCNADIETISYGKTSFVGNESTSGKVRDITVLYYLNNLSHKIEAESSEEALEILKQFFGR